MNELEKFIVIDSVSGDYSTEPIDRKQLYDYCSGGYMVSRDDIVYKLVPCYVISDEGMENAFKLIDYEDKTSED